MILKGVYNNVRVKEQTPVILTEEQRKQIKKLCINAFSAFCYKTIFTIGFVSTI